MLISLYWSIRLSSWGFPLHFQLIDSALTKEYHTGQWIAFSSNLVFVSIVLVVLIQKIFDGLQATIADKDQLQENYKRIFEKSPMPMWLFDTNSLHFLDVNDAAVAHYGFSKQ